jgi:hypothetical protein
MKRITEGPEGEPCTESIHRVSIHGIVLPASLQHMVNVMRVTQQGHFSIQMDTTSLSAGFNTGDRLLQAGTVDLGTESAVPHEAPPGMHVNEIECRAGRTTFYRKSYRHILL